MGIEKMRIYVPHSVTPCYNGVGGMFMVGHDDWLGMSRDEAHKIARRAWEERERELSSRLSAPIRRRASKNWRHIRRKVLRMNKSRVARACGVSRNTVRRWEDPASSCLPDAGHIGALFDGMPLTLRQYAPMIFGQEDAPDG